MSAPRKTSARRPHSAERATLSPAPVPAQPDALGPLRAVVRRWPVVVLVTLVLLAVAAVVALTRTPTYLATADVNVGRVDVRVQALPGYVAGAQALATAYSRIVTSDEVVTPLTRQLRLPAAEVRTRLAASPVPGGTSFRIYGTGDSEPDAVRFARAATAQVQRYVAAHDNGDDTLSGVLHDYREQSRTAATLRLRIDRLKGQQSAAEAATPAPSKRSVDRRQDEIARLQVALDTAELKMNTLGGRYAERGNELAATAGIEVITAPSYATDDRGQRLQRLLVIGLVAGLLLGSALALLADRRRT
jgi:uncharacterized protein involved in exopolysaccharide biosynthesis